MNGLTFLAPTRRPAGVPSDATHLHPLVADLVEGGPRRSTDAPPQLLCELAYATGALAAAAKARAVIRLTGSHDAWELGLERVGGDLLVSVYQSGALPMVALHERRVDVNVFGARLRGLLEPAPLSGARGRDAQPEDLLEAARLHLDGALPCARAADVDAASVGIEPNGDLPIAIGADIVLRSPAIGAGASVQRADLLSLLFRGKVRIFVGDHQREIPDVFVFPFAEQLASTALDAIDPWSRGIAFHRRTEVGGAVFGLRLNPKGAVSLTWGAAFRAAAGRAEPGTFPAVDFPALVQGILAFGRTLARSLVRRDRSQAQNLRLTSFRALLREVGDRLREATRNDSLVNAAPESYRAFAAIERPAARDPGSLGKMRLRFAARWMATVPSIDLRSTFLCGDALIVGASRETCCIDRTSGTIVWKRSLPRAASVVSPLGLTRLEGDGVLRQYDFTTGEALWTARLSPRSAGSTSGLVVAAAGLPRMVILAEGPRHLVAVDLHAGEIRWRYASRRAGPFRLRRAGKLLLVTTGDQAVTALDVVTGDVVWRYCDALRFHAPVAVDRDALFAVAGDSAFVARGGARLHHLDPWTGALRFRTDLPPGVVAAGAPLLARQTVVVVTQGRKGTGLVGFDRATGDLRFERPVTAASASCMVVDDLVIVNAESGELVGVEADTGSIRYRHAFGGPESDKPRRLEPVLRSGALFVPQNEVHVVGPRDGAILGKVPTDLIPDLLRVDERCDVYVVEESGHLAAFTAGPRLTLVQG